MSQRIRLPVISKMTNEVLLWEYARFQSWAGDDFSLSTPTHQDYRRADRVRDEILRRMGSASTPTPRPI